MNEFELVRLGASGHPARFDQWRHGAHRPLVIDVPPTYVVGTLVWDLSVEVGTPYLGAEQFQSAVAVWSKANVVSPVDPLDDEEYKEAQAELARVKKAAVEEDCPVPSDEIVEEAGELLARMFREAPFPYDVTPEDDGGIAIHAIHDEVYVCVILSADGPDRCFMNVDGERWRSTYTERPRVFGRFLKEALRNLRRYGR